MPCKNSLASMVSKASCRKSAAPRAPINSPMTSWTSSTRRVKHTPPVRRLSWPDGPTSNSGSPCIPEALRGPWHAKKKRRYHDDADDEHPLSRGPGERLRSPQRSHSLCRCERRSAGRWATSAYRRSVLVGPTFYGLSVFRTGFETGERGCASRGSYTFRATAGRGGDLDGHHGPAIDRPPGGHRVSDPYGTKIKAHHLSRKALVYVRQSTLHQVFEHRESTARQYGLSSTAQDLGWPDHLVEVIDDDLGQSGRSAQYRHGFQRLVADVALGQVGIVMGLEISRLARNNADFQQLLQICGLNQTLIYDADAIYELSQLNDRLILGLQGTMAEAELFTMRARLQGGLRHKASRGALATKLPVGFVYAPTGPVILDPDQQVQETLRLIFQSNVKLGASMAVVQYFNLPGRTFPTRPIKG